MADLGEALLDAATVATTETVTVKQLVSELGTRRVAELAGVTQRSVQRWVTEATQRRSPRAMTVKRLSAGKTLARWKRSGATVTGLAADIKVSQDTRFRTITQAVTIGPGVMGEVADRLQEGDTDGAAAAFSYGYASAYGVPTMQLEDVQELDVK